MRGDGQPDSQLPARKIQLLLQYLRQVGLDLKSLTAGTHLTADQMLSLPPGHRLPASYYSRVYSAAAQRIDSPLIWGAGVGSESFEVMCHSMIGALTLGDALRLATRFELLLFKINRYRMALIDEGTDARAKLIYEIDLPLQGSPLIPTDWERGRHALAMARASGLRTWHSLCGWLIGQPMNCIEVRIAAPPINKKYHNALAAIFNCPVYFDAIETALYFEPDLLAHRLVQTRRSLEEFLSNSVYHLITLDDPSMSTSQAIRSLLSADLSKRIPSFSEIAAMLYMSESSLRRRLQAEATSYQAIKDEVRCEVAMDRLLHDYPGLAPLAEMLGFTEVSSFARSFKKWTGETPSNYRRRAMDENHPGNLVR